MTPNPTASTMNLRLLFIYKENPQDPCLQGLKRWIPRIEFPVRSFCFLPNERRRGDRPENRTKSERLMRAVEDFEPTHVFCWVPYLNRAEVEWMKNRGLVVSIATNGVSSLHNGVIPDQAESFEVLRMLDCYFVPHEPHVPLLQEQRIHAVEMPFFVDPETYHPLPAWKRLWDIGGSDAVFIGNFGKPDNLQRPHRMGLVRELGKHMKVRVVSDYNPEAAGVRWSRPITRESALNRMLNRSRIALCFDYFPDVTNYNQTFTNPVLPYTERDQWTVRSRQFTMMGAGSAVMVERHPQIRRFFEDGRDIILWSSFEEAVERARHYLGRPDELRTLARNGLEKVLEHHTAERRIQQILDTLTQSR